MPHEQIFCSKTVLEHGQADKHGHQPAEAATREYSSEFTLCGISKRAVILRRTQNKFTDFTVIYIYAI